MTTIRDEYGAPVEVKNEHCFHAMDNSGPVLLWWSMLRCCWCDVPGLGWDDPLDVIEHGEYLP